MQRMVWKQVFVLFALMALLSGCQEAGSQNSDSDVAGSNESSSNAIASNFDSLSPSLESNGSSENSEASSSESSAAVSAAVPPDALDSSGRIVLGTDSEETVDDRLASKDTAAIETTQDSDGDTATGDTDVVSSGDGSASDSGASDLETSVEASLTAAPVADAGLPDANLGSSEKSSLPVEANVATEAEKNQVIAQDWPKPQAVLFVSGQQHGYIEPCGCTGLENQKGGLIRRDTLLEELRGRGWDLVPVDVGNQVRRTGPQPVLKFKSTAEAFEKMGYKAVTLGVDDLKLSSVELIQIAGSDQLSPREFLTANVSIIDESFFPSHRIVEVGGRKIGVTGVLGKEYQKEFEKLADVEVFDPIEKLAPVITKLQSDGCDFIVLLAHASLEESREIVRNVPGVHLVVTSGGFGEPTLHPEPVEGSKVEWSDGKSGVTHMVQVGVKGMYGGIVGLFDDPENPIRYQKIAISSQFKDSARMLELFAEYQQRIKQAKESTDILFEGLGIPPARHASGRTFVGSETCGECHTTAFEIWENSPHVHATESIIAADNERGGIPRHHDPECIACHATGWNVERGFYYPFESGFLTPDLSESMMGSGCENCHGPGSAHVEAEYGDVDVSNEELVKLQQEMVVKLEQVRQQRCIHCHDLDNSPAFHEEGAFEKYWERVKHYGKD